MAMRATDPLRDLLAIQNDMARLFGRTLGPDGEEAELQDGWTPAIDVQQTDDVLTVIAELPGLTASDVDITVEEGVLTLSGERKFYSGENTDSFRRVERRFGRFVRRIRLPQHSDTNAVQASMAEGVLRVEVPKSEQAKPKRIEVKATQS